MAAPVKVPWAGRLAGRRLAEAANPSGFTGANCPDSCFVRDGSTVWADTVLITQRADRTNTPEVSQAGRCRYVQAAEGSCCPTVRGACH
jgi:hypothetical protein